MNTSYFLNWAWNPTLGGFAVQNSTGQGSLEAVKLGYRENEVGRLIAFLEKGKFVAGAKIKGERNKDFSLNPSPFLIRAPETTIN